MYIFGDIVTVNFRKIKKMSRKYKWSAMTLITLKNVYYRKKFVTTGRTLNFSFEIVGVDGELHYLPASVLRRVRRSEQEHLDKLTIN